MSATLAGMTRPLALCCLLLCLLAATIILVSLVSIARDADWWVITRSEVRDRIDRWNHSTSGGQRH